MASTKITIPNTGAWVELTGGAAPTGPFQFSNLGPVDLIVQYAAAIPSANVPAVEPGDVYHQGQGDRPPLSTWALRAWARVAVPMSAAQLAGTNPSTSGRGFAQVTL